MTIVLNLQNLTQLFWTIIIALNLYVLLLLYRVSKLYRAERQIKLLATANLKEHIEFMRSRPTKSLTPPISATTRSRFFEQFDDTQPPRLRSCLRVRPDFRSYSSTTAADEDNDVPPHKQPEHAQHRSQPQKQLKLQVQQPPRYEQQQRHYQQTQTQPQQQQQQQQPQRQQEHQQRKAMLRQQQQKPQAGNKFMELDITSSSSVPMNQRDEHRSAPQAEDEHTLYISDSFGRVVHEIPFRESDYVDALYSVLDDRRWKVERAWNERLGEIQCRKSK